MDTAPAPDRDRLLWGVTGLVLALVVAIGLGPSLVGLRTFSAVDILSTKPPWRASAPAIAQPQVPYAGDTVDSNLPLEKRLHDDLAAGRVPWWTTLAVGGEPLLAVPDSGLLSPAALPYWVLPTWLAPAWAKLLEIAAICLGMVLLFRRLGLAGWAGLFAGTCYALSGFMVAWTGWPQARTAAFIPLLFYGVERLVQDRDARSTVLLGATVTALVLGGFPAVTGFALAAAGVHFLVRGLLPWGRLRQLVGTGLLGGVATLLGVGLAGLQVLPFLARWHVTDFSYRAIVPGTHPPPSAAATLFSPDLFGLGTPGQSFHGPVNPVEIQAFAGVAVLLLVLAAVTLVRLTGAARVTTLSYAGIAAVIASLTWAGGPLLEALQRHVPVFDNNPVARIVAVLGFLLSALAGVGLHGLVTRSWQRRGVPLALGVGAVGAVLTAVVLREARHDYLNPAMGHRIKVLALLAVVGLALLAAARFAPRTPALVAVLLLPALFALQALPLAHRWWPQNDPALFYPRTPVHDLLARELGHDRMATQQSAPVTGTSLAYGLRAVDGHSFVSQQWRELLSAASPATFLSPTYSTLPEGRDVLSSPALDRLAVRFVVTSPDKPLYGDLQDPAAGPRTATLVGTPVSLPLPAARARGVAVRLVSSAPHGSRPVRLHAQVVGPAGLTLATGEVDTGPGGVRWIPFPDLTVTPGTQVRLSASDGTAVVTADASGAPALGLARVPTGDTLRVVGSGGATVLERTTALPRFRLAARAISITDPAARLTALASGTLPRDEVVLDSGPVRTADPALGPRTLHVDRDDDGRVAVQVSAGREPYLVVADSDFGNWKARVNGHPVPLLRADHALVAVALPAGGAEVVLTAHVAGLRSGAAVSAGSGLLCLGLLAVPSLRARRRRRPAH